MIWVSTTPLSVYVFEKLLFNYSTKWVKNKVYSFAARELGRGDEVTIASN